MMGRDNFSRNLKHYRKLNRLTQAEFAELIGISTNFVARMEIDLALPSFETLQVISTTLKIPIDYLFRDDFADPQVYENSKYRKSLEQLTDGQVKDVLQKLKAILDVTIQSKLEEE